MAPLSLTKVIVATYSDFLRAPSDMPIPDFVRAPSTATPGTPWRAAVAARLEPGEHRAHGDDLAVMPYTSGSTGKPKACIHTPKTEQSTTDPYPHWPSANKDPAG